MYAWLCMPVCAYAQAYVSHERIQDFKTCFETQKDIAVFDDLCDLESRNCKWFNWNVGYVFINS